LRTIDKRRHKPADGGQTDITVDFHTFGNLLHIY